MEYAISNGYINEDEVIIGIPELLAQGYTYKYELKEVKHNGSYIYNPGTYNGVLEILSFQLFAPEDIKQENDLYGTDGFVFEFVANDVIIFEYTATVETRDISKEYDGTPLTATSGDITISGLKTGHVAIIDTNSYESIDTVGSVTNNIEFIIEDSSGNDVTDQYYIVTKFGKLKINERELSLTFDDPFVEKEVDTSSGTLVKITNVDYLDENGDPLYYVDGLITGHRLESFSTAFISKSGEYEITTFKVVDENGTDVTNNYILSADSIFVLIVYM